MNWKLIARSLTHGDMRKRIIAVVAILLVFRFLAQIPVPIANGDTLRQVLTNALNSNTSSFVGYLNVLSGGALANFSILIAGLGPYINASIIMQLLTKAIPKLEALHKEGEFGQKKINQYTRILTLPLAIVQSIGSIYLIRQYASQVGGVGDITANTSITQWILMVGALTGGSMLLMWLGEQVTEQSIGNGISLLITVGIVSNLPTSISQLAQSIYSKSDHWRIFGHNFPLNEKTFFFSIGLGLAVLALTWVVVMLNEAARNLQVNYAKRVQGNRAYGGISTTLPVKLITAGVVPIIFAVAFLSVPTYLGQLLSSNHSARLAHIGADMYQWFQAPSATTFAQGGFVPWIYPLTYFLLVFIFTFFYTSIAFNSKEIAENLQKQGGFLEGIRSGIQTEKYLARTVNRLTLFGAFSLGVLALVPITFEFIAYHLGLSITSLSISGTSVLILVSVALQTLRAVESRALMVTYDQYSRSDFFSDEEPTEAEPKRRRFGRNKSTIKKTDNEQK